MSGFTGFNPSDVSNSIKGVTRAYEDFCGAIIGSMQSKFVNGMSQAWACNQAQTFFNQSFKPAVDSLSSGATTIFESVVNSMNSAATSWASTTGSDWSNISFSPVNQKVDVSGILENINGVRGIDLETANSVTTSLATIKVAAETALTAAQNAVNNCGFVGKSQAETLIASLGTIKNRINQATTELTAATKEAINNTVSTYGDLGGQVAEAFNAQ